MTVLNQRRVKQTPLLSGLSQTVAARIEVLIVVRVVYATAQMGVNVSKEAALPVELNLGIMQFGHVREFEHLRRSVARITAQAIGGALNQPLRCQAHIVHQHLRPHYGNR